MSDTEEVGAAAAAYDLEISRERLVRLIQTRVLTGRIAGGRWLVDSRSIERYKVAEHQKQALLGHDRADG